MADADGDGGDPGSRRNSLTGAETPWAGLDLAPAQRTPAATPPAAPETTSEHAPSLDPLDAIADAGALELDSLDALPQTSSTAMDAAMGGGGRVLGSGFDDLEEPGPMPDLELEDLPSAHSSAPPAARSFARPSAGAAPVLRGAPPPEPDVAADPAALDPNAPSAAAVAAVAEFGEPPNGWLGAVPYALLVLTRQRALRASLADLRRLQVTATRDHRDARVTLGRALHAAAATAEDPTLAEPLAEADKQGQRAGQQTTEWETAREAAEAQRSSLESKLAEVEESAKPYRDQASKLATQMDVREAELARVRARLARVEIEIRNLSAPEADTSRRGPLEADREARRAEVASAQGHVDELRPRLEAARRELAVMLEARNDLEGQLRAVGKARERTEKIHLMTASEAEERYHDAVAALADAALASGVAESLAEAPSRAARLMEATERTRAREVAVHEAALDAYDRTWRNRGLVLLAVGASIIVTMLLFVIFR